MTNNELALLLHIARRYVALTEDDSKRTISLIEAIAAEQKPAPIPEPVLGPHKSEPVDPDMMWMRDQVYDFVNAAHRIAFVMHDRNAPKPLDQCRTELRSLEDYLESALDKVRKLLKGA